MRSSYEPLVDVDWVGLIDSAIMFDSLFAFSKRLRLSKCTYDNQSARDFYSEWTND